MADEKRPSDPSVLITLVNTQREELERLRDRVKRLQEIVDPDDISKTGLVDMVKEHERLYQEHLKNGIIGKIDAMWNIYHALHIEAEKKFWVRWNKMTEQQDEIINNDWFNRLKTAMAYWKLISFIGGILAAGLITKVMELW